MAERARRWAMMIPGDEAAQRLLGFAEELEARADALEIAKPPIG